MVLRKYTKKRQMIIATSREFEVIELIMDGLTTNEISEYLAIKKSTVLRHRENLLKNNSCSSMEELVFKYFGVETLLED